MLPTVVVGTAFLALVGPGGLLGVRLDGTIWAILAAHVFFNVAVVLRTVGGLWAHLDPRLEEAARMLGASRWRAFATVTLPLLRPALAAAASLVFLFTFTSFGTVLLLGGPGLATLEVEIYRHTTALFDLPLAAVLALVQMVGVTAVLLAYSRYQERRTVEQDLRPAAEASRRPRTAGERALVAGTLAGTSLLLLGPPAVLVARSLGTGSGWGLAYYRALGTPGAHRGPPRRPPAGGGQLGLLRRGGHRGGPGRRPAGRRGHRLPPGPGLPLVRHPARCCPWGPRRSPSASASSWPSTPPSTCAPPGC